MRDFGEARYETAHFYMSISNGVLYFEYKPILLLHYSLAKDLIRERLDLQGPLSYPVLCKTTGLQDLDKGARDLLASSGSLYTKAVAIVDARFIAKSMVDFYIVASEPLIPTSIFRKEKQALDYLKPYV